MNDRHIIARTVTARADGQLADDALLIHNAAVNYGHDEMAADTLAQYENSIGNLYLDAVAEAAAAGVQLDMATAPGPRCPRHPYYLDRSHGGWGCPICL
ncbi:hypothetical protein SAMN04489727_1737 [Amycolatopsis tolypomycina]|uniref:Uncharacterized protein n=1 Tax=Amycolatopsis tolypomycina TaxID=208445 RepID=A0A1H4JCB0_9PSEU|nr:hypothetical protein [Amycolatopsis tolypomycina]SEB43715.1 hypothetical protein SAMN04489727_1737 [Amycolatopsis tolypomycina]